MRGLLRHWSLILRILLLLAHLAYDELAQTHAAYFEDPAHLAYEELAQTSAVYFEDFVHLAIWKP